MKQVVISPCENLLNLYWFMKYASKKKIKVFPYKAIYNSDYSVKEYKKINSPDKNDWEFSSWCKIELLNIDCGQTLSKKDFDKIENKSVIYHRDYLDNREDKDLISIAKKINDDSKIKICEIPNDVLYHIEDCECSIGEQIVESHRIWY